MLESSRRQHHHHYAVHTVIHLQRWPKIGRWNSQAGEYGDRYHNNLAGERGYFPAWSAVSPPGRQPKGANKPRGARQRGATSSLKLGTVDGGAEMELFSSYQFTIEVGYIQTELHRRGGRGLVAATAGLKYR